MWKIYKQTKTGLVFVTSTSNYGTALAYKATGYIIQDSSQYTNDTSVFNSTSNNRINDRLAEADRALQNVKNVLASYNADNNANLTYPESTNVTVTTNPIYIATIITFLILLAIWSTYK